MNICLGSTRGAVPFLQQGAPAVKHLPHCTVCAAYWLFFWGPSRCWKQIRELVIRVPPGIRRNALWRLKEVWPSTEIVSTLHFLLSLTARWSGPFGVKTWMWCPLFHHNSYSLLLLLPLPPLPMNLNHAPQSVFSLRIPGDWLIIKHATTHPLQSHQVSEHCDGMFSKFW